MPILKREPDIYPDNLLEADFDQRHDRIWWCIYTRSRREKDLMRKLYASQIPFFGPVIERRFRSPNGRIRSSFVPLFSNYVFIFANAAEKQEALTTNCISQSAKIQDPEPLVHDLRQIRKLIRQGADLTPESNIEQGDHVRVKSGPFQGIEGTILRREGKTRFLVAVEYLNQGVSMELDEALIEAV